MSRDGAVVGTGAAAQRACKDGGAVYLGGLITHDSRGRERRACPVRAGGRGRRRRSNRPGNSQANVPRGEVTLESRRRAARTDRLTDGVRPGASLPGQSLRSFGQRGHARHFRRGVAVAGGPMTESHDLETTPLTELHEALGAKMVPFAGYLMPVQFPLGILGEHRHTRAKAGLFDVSHMGQLRIDGAGAAERLEALVPGDITGLGEGRTRYTQFTNAEGGILDDLMVTNAGDHLFVVVNAACKQADTAHLRAAFGDAVTTLGDRALLALQGPSAAAV